MAYNSWSRIDLPTYYTRDPDPRFAHELDIAVVQQFTISAMDVVRAYASPIDTPGRPRQSITLREVRRDIIPRLNDVLQGALHDNRPFANDTLPQHMQVKASRGTKYGQFLHKTADLALRRLGYSLYTTHNDSGYSLKE